MALEVELAAALNYSGLLQYIFEGVLTEAPVCPTCCHFHSTCPCTAPRPCPLAMLIPILLLIASCILIIPFLTDPQGGEGVTFHFRKPVSQLFSENQSVTTPFPPRGGRPLLDFSHFLVRKGQKQP